MLDRCPAKIKLFFLVCILFFSCPNHYTYSMTRSFQLVSTGSFLIKPELQQCWQGMTSVLQGTAGLLLGADSGLHIAEFAAHSNASNISTELSNAFAAPHKVMPSLALAELATTELLLATQGFQRWHAGLPMPPGSRVFHLFTGSGASTGLMMLCFGISADVLLAIQIGNIVVVASYGLQAITTNWKQVGFKPLLFWQVIVGNLGGITFAAASFIPPEYMDAINSMLTAGLGMFFLALVPNSVYVITQIIRSKFIRKPASPSA